MKTFWTALLLFLIPIFLLLAAMEFELRRIPNDYSYKHERLVRDGGAFRYLVLGSSHAYRGVEPERVGEGGFNASNISQDLGYDRIILERYSPYLPDLKYVILPISYGSLGGQLAEGKEAWRVKNYTLYMGIDKDAHEVEHYFELLNRPMREQVQMLTSYIFHGKDNRVCANSGASSRSTSMDRDLERSGKEAAARHFHPSLERMENGKREVLKIARMAEENGFRLLLFTAPAWSTYTDHLDSTQLRHTVEFCQELAASDPMVEYQDLLRDPRFLESDFADADHVSLSGQRKLSKILGDSIRSMDVDSLSIP